MLKNRSFNLLYVVIFFCLFIFNVPLSFAQNLKITVIRADTVFACYPQKLKYTIKYSTSDGDSVVVFQAQQIGKVKIVYKKSFGKENGRLYVYHEDRDFDKFRKLLDLSKTYKRETYQAQCSTSTVFYRSIDWGVDSCGFIGPIYCTTPQQKIYWVEKAILEWFESKFVAVTPLPRPLSAIEKDD